MTTAIAKAPTLAQIRKWPAAVDVPPAAAALGISRSHAYELIKIGKFPATVVSVRRRHKVLTASLIRVLES
jgi:hypothetical protein